MREICQSGSEGGGGESLSLPLSMIQFFFIPSTSADTLWRIIAS
jgi:hypothetical protein